MSESASTILGVLVAGAGIYVYMVYQRNTRRRTSDVALLAETPTGTSVTPVAQITGNPLNRQLDLAVEPPSASVTVRPEASTVQQATTQLLQADAVDAHVVTLPDPIPAVPDLTTLGGRVDNFIATSGILRISGLRVQDESERVRNKVEWEKFKDIKGNTGRGAIIRMTAYRAGLSNTESKLINHPLLKELWS